MKSRTCSRSASALGLRSKSTTNTSLRSDAKDGSVALPRAWRRGAGGQRCGVLQRGHRRWPKTWWLRRTVPGMRIEAISGIARHKVDLWLAANVAHAVPPFDYRLIAGGRSNLTYVVVGRDDVRFVLRRPPLGHVLESAHDMSREYRIILALAPTSVPVPRPLAFC